MPPWSSPADPRQALAMTAALWFGAQPETMVAVTGTNGKTSVATFTRQIWQELGQRAVNLGTTGVEGDWHAPLATPRPSRSRCTGLWHRQPRPASIMPRWRPPRTASHSGALMA